MLLSSCSTLGKVPNPEICVEIPFQDGPEGACSLTTESKARLVDAETWEKEKPLMILIHSKYWSEVKLFLKKSCRYANKEEQGSCETRVDSMDSAIMGLQDMAEKFIKLGAK